MVPYQYPEGPNQSRVTITVPSTTGIPIMVAINSQSYLPKVILLFNVTMKNADKAMIEIKSPWAIANVWKINYYLIINLSDTE